MAFPTSADTDLFHKNFPAHQMGENVLNNDAGGGDRLSRTEAVSEAFSRSVNQCTIPAKEVERTYSSLSIKTLEDEIAPQEQLDLAISLPCRTIKSVQEARQVISKNPVHMTIEEFANEMNRSGSSVGCFSNCDTIEEVEVFFLSDIHEQPVPRQINTAIIDLLHQPGDRVFLEDTDSPKTNMIDCSQLPEDIEYRCWDNKRLPRDWIKPNDQLIILYKKIEELATSGASKSQWLSFYTNEVLPVIREHKNLIDGFKDQDVTREFEDAKLDLLDAIDFGVDYQKIIERCCYLSCLSVSKAIMNEILVYAQESFQSRQEGLVSSLVHEEGRSFIVAGQLHFLGLEAEGIETRLKAYLDDSQRKYLILYHKKPLEELSSSSSDHASKANTSLVSCILEMVQLAASLDARFSFRLSNIALDNQRIQHFGSDTSGYENHDMVNFKNSQHEAGDQDFLVKYDKFAVEKNI